MANLTTLTLNQKIRVQSEINACKNKIDKEMNYSTDLRDHIRISELREHLDKLNNMLKYGWDAPIF